MDEQVRLRAEKANREVYQEIALRSGGEVNVNRGVLLVKGVHPSPVIANAAFRVDPTLCSGHEVIDIVEATFTNGRSASLVTDPHFDGDVETAAEESGWTCFIELTEMVRPNVTTPSPRLPSGYELVDVTETNFHELRRALSIGFGDENADIESMIEVVFGTYASVQPPGIAAVLARSDNGPAAAGVLYIRGQVGVVGIVGTVPRERRKGLGAAVTSWLTDAAFDAGCDFACLESSPEGVSVYEGVGYQEIGTRRVWLPSL